MILTDLTQEQIIDLGISLGIILIALIFGRWIISMILNKVVKRLTRQTQTTLDDIIIKSLKSPAYWLAMVATFQAASARIDFLTESLALRLDDIYFVLYTWIVFVIGWRLIGSLIEWYQVERAPKSESKLNEQLIPFLRRFAYAVLVVIMGIILLDRFNIEISGFVATLGIGSLAIALAAQAALSDIITGILIMIDRPFRIGDRIEILDLDTWGDVIDIGLRSTRVRTRDNRMVIVPNSVIGKSLVVNYSFPDSQYRIQTEIGIATDSDIEKTREVIVKAVRVVEGVLEHRPVEALFLHFGDSSLTFRVRWWLDSYIDTRRMFDRVNTAIHKALKEANITMPYPQRDVHHKIDDADAKNISAILNRKS